MAKISVCDFCGTQQPSEAIYGNPPGPWFYFRSSDYKIPEKHLCSLACLIALGQGLAEQQKEQAHG